MGLSCGNHFSTDRQTDIKTAMVKKKTEDPKTTSLAGDILIINSLCVISSLFWDWHLSLVPIRKVIFNSWVGLLLDCTSLLVISWLGSQRYPISEIEVMRPGLVPSDPLFRKLTSYMSPPHHRCSLYKNIYISLLMQDSIGWSKS